MKEKKSLEEMEKIITKMQSDKQEELIAAQENEIAVLNGIIAIKETVIANQEKQIALLKKIINLYYPEKIQ